MHLCKPKVSREGSLLTVWIPTPVLLFTWEAHPAAVTSSTSVLKHIPDRFFQKAGLSSNTVGTLWIKLYEISQWLINLNIMVYLNQYKILYFPLPSMTETFQMTTREAP